jgi:hypothetical protein
MLGASPLSTLPLSSLAITGQASQDRTYIVPLELRTLQVDGVFMENQFTKDPDSTMDYSVDYSLWITSSDSLVNSIWFADSGISIVSSSVDAGTHISTVRLSGGTVNGLYQVTNRISTANGLTTDRTLFIRVLEK